MSSKALLPLLLATSACASAPSAPGGPDRTAYLAHVPRSILVLPSRDGTLDPDAIRGWLPTITRPLAERGYYVFPVAVADAIVKETGASAPEELRELFGADAVLYVGVEDWGTSVHDLELETKVTLSARLVDLSSGAELWSGTSSVAQRVGEGSLFEKIVSGLDAANDDPSVELARQASRILVQSPDGLLLGPRHPGFAADQRDHRERLSSR